MKTMPKVVFHYYAPKAKKVLLVGGFNQGKENAHPLKKSLDGKWKTFLSLPYGEYEYLYLVDGKWHVDPHAKTIPNEWGSEYSVVNIIP